MRISTQNIACSQRETETDRQRQRETERHRDREAEREKQTEGDRKTDRQSNRQTEKIQRTPGLCTYRNHSARSSLTV